MKKQNVLLTGAFGTVGKEVLNQLYQKKDLYNITAFDIKSSKANKISKTYNNHVNVVFGNITDQNDINRISQNQDFVIHLAAIIPPLADEKPDLSYQVNTKGTEKLIRSLEKNSPNAFFMYSSSISVYGDRIKNPFINIDDELKPSIGDEYAKTKIESESILKNSKLDWTIFRLSAIMGGHKMSKLMFHQPLETSMEIATPTDTARAFVNAIDKQGQLSRKVFNLSGGKDCRISYKDFLSRSFEVFGLGNLNFAPKSFAEKNFHCGFYNDGDDLEHIVNFRNDNLDDYFEKEKSKVSSTKRFLASILKKPIKKYLQKQSEPLIAFKNRDEKLMQHFFNS